MAEEKDAQGVEEPMVDNTNISTATTKPKKCPKCGHLNPWKRTTCRKCGEPLAENKPVFVCPDCGYEVQQDAEKCPYCELPIEEIRARVKFLK